jgi:hypothetical protein
LRAVREIDTRDPASNDFDAPWLVALSVCRELVQPRWQRDVELRAATAGHAIDRQRDVLGQGNVQEPFPRNRDGPCGDRARSRDVTLPRPPAKGAAEEDSAKQ